MTCDLVPSTLSHINFPPVSLSLSVDFAPLKFLRDLLGVPTNQPEPFRRKLPAAPPARDPICGVEFAPPAVSRSRPCRHKMC
ncbi:Dual-specificity RNA methyltransferase RlmN [Dissostichus eleginoides]|uniref:Dual-specificity RNA methyltransferase RlmN n=1 Tax=Dissostichus eleginoides TaxID=100907 RepID=A0AAD9F7J1_DISEL|nr:Dual-specificity RNA methyltransferase RlmN [Dissostichus eleginoides]